MALSVRPRTTHDMEVTVNRLIVDVLVTATAALGLGLVAAVGFGSLTAAAADTPQIVQQHLEQVVAVRDVHGDADQVSGVLVNLSDTLVHDVRVQIDRAWLWADERNPGAAEDSPGRTAVYTVPGEIPPGGRVSFTYRSDTPLPQRSDGRFETSVAVVGLVRMDQEPHDAH